MIQQRLKNTEISYYPQMTIEKLFFLFPVSDGRCLAELEEAAFRPNGLLVFRRPDFEVAQVETKVPRRQ